ncbi:MAG: response regulator transcription factor [Acidocella sp.]|jgi:two-component system OmpR family response regulator|nr:response regulator transcription factor [Acidocella sp.]
MKILLIEDDPKTVEFLRAGLEPEGYVIASADDGRKGLISAASGDFDLLIVDRLLPGLDGVALVRTLRAANITTPVLFLTALGGIDDRVEGLRAGGDDYLVKPFALAELSARVIALTRRRPPAPKAAVLKIADLELDRLSRRVTRAGKKIDLKPREFQLLEYLMLHENQVVTRTMLLEAVWDFHFDPITSVVESHISRLRSKLDRGFGQELIQTYRGSGYRITSDA